MHGVPPRRRPGQRHEEEAAKAANIPYVTTNDVIASAFANECQSRIIMMSFDCRAKVPGLSPDLAGNFVTALTTDPDTFGTPALIRNMLNSTPYQTTMTPLPSCGGWRTGKDSAKFSMVANWSSLAGDLIQFESCETIIHLPVKNPAYMAYDMMIPLATGKGGKKGLLCWTVSTDVNGLKEALPEGGVVSKALFP